MFIFYFDATAADMKKFRVSAYRRINTVFEYVSSFRTAQKQGLRVCAHRLVTLKNEVYTYVSAIVFFRATHCVTLRKRKTTEFAIFEVVVGRCRWF